MNYDARQIANWFVRRAANDGKQLSIMSLLKLVYIAHGWHLEMKSKPLVFNRIEAWQYGPVIPDVYNAFRRQGVSVSGAIAGYDSEIPASESHLLEQIYSIYGNLSAFQLSELTHVSGGPWDTASRMGGNYAEIPNDEIERHYRNKRRSAVIENAGV